MSSDELAREGSGLTRVVYQKARDRVAGGQESSFILLLPTRTLVQKVTRCLLEESGRQAAGGMRILTLDAFVSRIADLRRWQSQIVDGTAREALLDAVLQRERSQGRAQYLATISEFPGTTWSIGRLISELMQAGVSPHELKAAAQTVRGRLSGAEIPRLDDMAAIYGAYCEVLNSKKLIDPEDRYAKALEVLKDSGGSALAGVDALYVDGFYHLSPAQGRVICELARHVKEYIFALEDPVSGEFRWVIERTRKHAGGIEMHLEPPPAHHLAHRLFNAASQGDSSRASDSHGAGHIPEVRLVSGPDVAGEVRAIAKEIKQRSFKPSNVCLVVRDQEAYVPVIERVFFEEGIPLDGGWSFRLDSNPAVRAVLILLEAAMSREEFDLLRVMKSDYLVSETDVASEVAAVFRGTRRSASRDEWITMLGEEAGKARKAAEDERAKEAQGARNAGLAPDQDAEEDDGFVSGRTATAGRLEKRASALERALDWATNLFEILQGVRESGKAPEFGAWLWGALDRLGFKQNIVAPRRENSDELTERTVARDWAAFSELKRTIDRVDAISKLTERGTVTLAQWVSQVREAVADSTYRVAAPSRGGVQMISPSQAVGLEFDTVFIVGLVDGVFPKAAPADWVFTEGIRRALGTAGIDLELSSDLARYEKFLFFLGVRMASRTLYLCYPEAEADGTANLRSDFVAETLRAAGVQEQGADGSEIPGSDIVTEAPRTAECKDQKVALVHRQLKRSEVVPARLADITTDRELGLKVAKDLWDESMQTCCDREEEEELAVAYAYRHASEWHRLRGVADIEDGREAGAPSAWNGRMQDPLILDWLSEEYHSGRIFSVSALSDYAKCPFKYFIEHVLRLEPTKETEEDVDPRTKGSILHRTLQLVMDRYRGRSLKDMDPNAVDSVVEEAVATALAEAQAEGLRMRPSLLKTLRRKVIALAGNVVARDIKRADKFQGEIRPKLLEWGFGLEKLRGSGSRMDRLSDSRPLQIGDGQDCVRVGGKVDRVDEVIGPDGTWNIVYDYKQNSTPSQDEIESAVALQPAVYAAAVGGAVGEVRAAAFYSAAEGKITSGMARQDAMGVLGWGASKSRGVYSADMMDNVISEVLAKVVEYARGIRAGVFTPEPRGVRTCDQCPAKDICRHVETAAEAEEDTHGGEVDGDG